MYNTSAVLKMPDLNRIMHRSFNDSSRGDCTHLDCTTKEYFGLPISSFVLQNLVALHA